jgi:hypothetical protein
MELTPVGNIHSAFFSSLVQQLPQLVLLLYVLKGIRRCIHGMVAYLESQIVGEITSPRRFSRASMIRFHARLEVLRKS